MTIGYEYRFRIDAFTPATLPMARLAEYMSSLASLLGHPEHVHFVGLEAGSVVLIQRIEREAAPKVASRVQSVGRGEGPPDALRAFRELDHKLAQDNAIAALLEPDGAEIITFPGRDRRKPLVYGSFRQQGSLDGILVRVGGKDDTAHATLQDGPTIWRCEVAREMAQSMAQHLYGPPLRVFGEGRWRRAAEGAWELEQFRALDFEVLDDAALPTVVARLRAIEGAGWRQLEDPQDELHRIRHGPNEIH